MSYPKLKKETKCIVFANEVLILALVGGQVYMRVAKDFGEGGNGVLSSFFWRCGVIQLLLCCVVGLAKGMMRPHNEGEKLWGEVRRRVGKEEVCFACFDF